MIEDITDRAKAEETVRASEERFRIVFENVFDGISIYTENSDPFKRRLVECNERYAALAGRTREELLAIGFTRALQIPSPEAPNGNEAWSPDRDTPLQGLFSWIRPDGKESVIEYVGVPLSWHGEPHTIGIDRDITKRMHMEETLRESEARLRVMFDSSRDAIGVSKTRHPYVCQSRVLKLFGFENNDSIVGTPIRNSARLRSVRR